ncbi:MAG: hypothetical protein L3J51_12780 [Cocleimonas sp.]|nr:hypothetical protein [Cocleimonas sp.]
MISIQNNTSPINIGILEVSSQNRAVLSFFIDSIGADVFKEVNLDQATAFIIDYDFPGAKESWAELQSTKKPAIILSAKEIEMPNSIWVKKPLTAKALTDARQKIYSLINDNLVQATEREVSVEDIPSSQSLEAPELNDIVTETTAVEKDKVPALASLVATSNPMPTLNESMPTIDLEPALATATTGFSIAPREAENEITLDITQPTTKVSTTNQDSVPNEVDSLLNDLQELQAVEKSTINKGVPTLTPAPTSNISNSATTSSDLTDTLTLEVQQEITQPTNEVVATETSELDSLLNDLHAEPQTIAESVELAKIENTDDHLILQEGSHHEFTAEDPDIATENQSNDATEADLFNELIIDAPIETSQETQANEQSILIDDSKTTDIVNNDTSAEPHLAAEITESFNETNDGDLEAMLNELQQEMRPIAGSTANSNTDTYNADGNVPKTYQGTQAQERWALLCGDKQLTRNASDIKKTAFILDEHLLSSLLETIKEGKATKQIKRIKYEDLLIIIDHKTDTIYSDLSIYSEEYANICFEPIKNDQIRIHSLDDSEIRMLHQQIKNDPENVYTTEAFIWTTSLLTSRGRLLKNTNTSKTVGLKSWPNLTRIESFPHMMNIAAVFSKNPGNLLDISKWLNIPQCYVFAFYNAAFFLDMIDLDSSVVSKNNIKRLSFNFGSKKKSENSSLFSRLLNKIKG